MSALHRLPAGIGSCFLGLLMLWPAASFAACTVPFCVQFHIGLAAGQAEGAATIRIRQSDGQLRGLDLDMPVSVFSDVEGDGRVTRRNGRLQWQVPPRGGELRYRVQIDHRRGSGGYDAKVADHWAIFRADDLIPSAAARFRPGVRGYGELRFDLPTGWSVFTPYRADAAGRMTLTGSNSRFPRPVGWVIAGQVGSRMDRIGGTEVRVAAPRGQPVPRLPMLALLRSSLPLIRARLSDLPDYLLVVAGGDPMWRGGLSAANSLYLHADRPLISENATSPLLHELFHVVAPVATRPDQDWIDEGLAEYLALRTLRDSDTISRERFADSIETFRRRGHSVRNMRTRHSRGAVTARAVAVFHDLDQEIQTASDRQADLYDVVRQAMASKEPLDLNRLRQIAAGLNGGRVPSSLSGAAVPLLPEPGS
ncbi:MAG: hypothetical protein FJ197_08850 [Gammaproteobacteria bacterium]|nr:hypothetical protein [Gammaproteobacteria bacterium]